MRFIPFYLVLLFIILINGCGKTNSYQASSWDALITEGRNAKDSITLKKILYQQHTSQANTDSLIPKILYNVLLARLVAHNLDNQNEQSNTLYQQAYTLSNKLQNKAISIWVETQIGSYFYRHNNYEEALRYFNKTRHALLTEQSLIIPEKTNVLKRNAYFFQTIKNYEAAKSLLEVALGWCCDTCDECNNVILSLGTVSFLMEDYETARAYFDKSLKMALTNKDDIHHAKTLGELGLLEKKIGHLELAEQHFIKDIALSVATGDERNLMYARIQLGCLYIETKEYNKASAILQTALNYAQSKEYLKGYQYEIYKKLLHISQFKNDTSSEIIIRRKLDLLESQIQDTESEAKVSQINWQAQNEQIQWKLDSNKAKLSKVQTAVWICCIAFLIIIGVFCYMHLVSRKKMQKRASSIDTLIQSFHIEKNIAEEKLQITEHSLSSFQVYLEEKNNQIEHLQKELQSLKENQASESFSKQKSNLEDLLESHLMTDENWNNFKKSFIEEKHFLYNSIISQLPGLTESNLRIIMLHVLGLNNIQSANTLGVSYEAVKKAKQRLRKKYGDAFDNLIETIENIDAQKN